MYFNLLIYNFYLGVTFYSYLPGLRYQIKFGTAPCRIAKSRAFRYKSSLVPRCGLSTAIPNADKFAVNSQNLIRKPTSVTRQPSSVNNSIHNNIKHFFSSFNRRYGLIRIQTTRLKLFISTFPSNYGFT